MKLIILFLPILLLPCVASAETYYISESAGNDNWDGTAGSFVSGTTGPWRTLDKIQSSEVSGGDRILLRCGDTWHKNENDWIGTWNGIEIKYPDLVIGAYYMDGGESEVDGSAHTCAGAGLANPVIDGDVLTFPDHKNWNYIFRIKNDGSGSGSTIQDIKFTNYYKGVGIWWPEETGPQETLITNITIQRCTFDNFAHAAIYASGNGVDNWVVDSCTIINLQMAFYISDPWQEKFNWFGNGISIFKADNFTLRNTIVGRSYGECISFRGGADYGLAENNIIFDCGANALKSVCSDNVTFRYNWILGTSNHGTFYRGTKNPSGISIFDEADVQGFHESSGNRFYGNVCFGLKSGGFSLMDQMNDDDSAVETNYVYNNLFIDNGANYYFLIPQPSPLSPIQDVPDPSELTVEFRNNLAVINNPDDCNHISSYIYGSGGCNGCNAHKSEYWVFAGNGWDETEYNTVGTDYRHTNDVVGDPGIVNPTPCDGSTGWWHCASYDTPGWGDAAFTSASDFIDVAQTLEDIYKMGLDKASSWPGSVLTLDQNQHGSGWEFGAYVYPEAACVEEWDCTEWSCSACAEGQQECTRACIDLNECGTENEKPPESETRACETAGLVGWWTMDAEDISDGQVLDMSGNGNHASMHGTTPAQGQRNGALYFDGIDDYLDTGYAADLDAWTAAFWVRGDSAPGSDRDTGPVMKQENFLISWDHTWEPARGGATLRIGGIWHPAAKFGTLEGSTWYHLAATYDGETIRAYRNGQPEGENTNPSGIPDHSEHSMKIGRHAVNDYFFAGTIDDVRVYDGALSGDDILAFYECHAADHDCDNCVDGEELTNFITLWKVDSTATPMPRVMEAVGLWKKGTGCLD